MHYISTVCTVWLPAQPIGLHLYHTKKTRRKLLVFLVFESNWGKGLFYSCSRYSK